jgi:uncharacterized protein (DUF1810 family)
MFENPDLSIQAASALGVPSTGWSGALAYAPALRAGTLKNTLIAAMPQPPTSGSDPFDLQRFIEAQRPLYSTVLAELRTGRKRTHWIWFVFPQVKGLGHSSMAQHYAIRSREEAAAYLRHPVLGARLIECTEVVVGVADRTAHEIFGSPDYLKFRSSMTLFDAAGGQAIFRRALDRFYQGTPDEATLAILDHRGRQ